MQFINQDKITIEGQNIGEVEEFTYMGAVVCKERGGMKDLKECLSKARSAIVRLKKTWRSNSISRRTKMKPYKDSGCALPVIWVQNVEN